MYSTKAAPLEKSTPISLDKIDLDAIFEEQRKKLLSYGIVSGGGAVTSLTTNHTAGDGLRLKSSQDSERGHLTTLRPQNFPNNGKPTVALPESRDVLAGSPHVAQKSEKNRLANLGNSGQELTTDAVLNRIRARSNIRTQSSAGHGLQGASSTVDIKPNVSPKSSPSKPDLIRAKNQMPAAHGLERAGFVKDGETQPFTDTDAKALNYIDETAKTMGKEAAISVLKNKLHHKSEELLQASSQAAANAELAVTKTTQVAALVKEQAALKEQQAIRDENIRVQTKQLGETRNNVENLTKKVECLSRDVALKRKQCQDKKKSGVSSDVTVGRHVAVLDKAKKELATLKNEHLGLREFGEKQQAELRSERAWHQENLHRLLKIILKQNDIIQVRIQQRDLIGLTNSLLSTENELRTCLKLNNISSESV